MPVAGCLLRVAGAADAEGVSAVLENAYTIQMAASYDAAVLKAALPAMTRANSALLASGSYYVQTRADGQIVSCGGWTREEPGTRRVEDGIAHVRHFGTRSDCAGRGLGKDIFARCRQDAFAAGVQSFMSFSSLNAEAFYASLGFTAIRRIDIRMGGAVSFPSVVMVWRREAV